MVTWPENPPSKYFAVTSATRALTRARNACPISIFLPETRNGMIDLRWSLVDAGLPRLRGIVRTKPALSRARRNRISQSGRQGTRPHGRLFLPPPLHRRGYAHCLAILRDGPSGDIDSRLTQLFHDGVVGQHLRGAFGIDQ